MSFDKMKSTLTEALSALGISEYEIYYMSSSDTSVETLNKEISSFSSGERGGICLRVVYEGKLGYASSELMDEDEMRELAGRAVENAKYVEKPDEVGIFSGSDSYEEKRVPEYVPMSADVLKNYALTLGKKVFDLDKRVAEGSSTSAASSGTVIRIVNSHGLDLSCECGVNVAVADAVVSVNGEKQSAYSFDKIDKENSLDNLAGRAVEDALLKVGAAKVPSGKYNIVISGKQMKSILSVFSSAFSARQVLDGLSMLKGKLGEKIASDAVTITDDPQREGNSVGTTFDAEGVATTRRVVVDKGVLMTYLHNRETAMAMNTESTANASKADYSSPITVRPHSFCIETGEYTRDELFGMAKDGIYITEVKGLHAGANPVTGDFSLESAGFMIRDGKLGEAVHSFTVAGNFFDVIKNVKAVGCELEVGVPTSFTSFGSPDVLIPEMSVAGE